MPHAVPFMLCCRRVFTGAAISFLVYTTGCASRPDVRADRPAPAPLTPIQQTVGNPITDHDGLPPNAIRPASGPAPNDSAARPSQGEIRIVSHQETPPVLPEEIRPGGPVGPVPRNETMPVDLPTAFQLAAGDNPQVRLARERIRAAVAQYDQASVLWLPSISAGPRWLRHDGQIQDTRGDVIRVSRNSLFVGGGATVSVDTAEARFAPLAARQVVAAHQAGSRATTNSTLLDVSNGYWDLVRSYSNEAIVREAVENSQALEKLAESYLRNEKLKQADAERIRAEVRARLQELDLADQDKRVASARIARLLRLDPFLTLVPAEERPVPIDLTDLTQGRQEFAATALGSRPELAESRALANAAAARLRQVQYGPWLPSLLLDYDAGGFGGGPNDFFGDFDGRSDAEAAAIWTVRNLGHGEWAAQRERASEVRQARLRIVDQMDRVVSEVAESLARVDARRAQLDSAQMAVEAAQRSYDLNIKLFREGGIELILPIEVVQSVNALARARQDYLTAVVEHNRAQFELLWALGFPLQCVGDRPLPPANR